MRHLNLQKVDRLFSQVSLSEMYTLHSHDLFNFLLISSILRFCFHKGWLR